MNQAQSLNANRSEREAQTGKRLAALLARPGLVVVLLVVITVAVFWPLKNCEFINHDDPVYVTSNPHVRQGLSLNSLIWAFTTGHSGNWHPLTWLSHMLDVVLFGLKPAGPHVVNLLLHAANTVLLFLVLRQLTGAHWRSGFVAALFALHPLHVESVAWISERKDVLSTFFFLLTLMAYGRYVQESKVQSPKSKVWYGWALVYFVLGLMSKPMVVTVPFVLLLLDYWPLGRVAGFGSRVPSSGSRVSLPLWLLVREKLPFLAVSAIFCVITLVVQTPAMESLSDLPVGRRIANALVSYVWYLGKTIWPTDLALPYLHPGQWPVLSVAFSLLLLGVLCVEAFRLSRRAPFVLTGWLWFLGTLVPVIGLVQVGIQAMADRYSYLPLIGLFLILSWGAAAVMTKWHLPKMTAAIAGVLVLGAGALRTRDQLGYWHNSETLFRHTLAVTQNNYVAYDNLGFYLNHHDRPEEGLELFHQALRINPADATAYNNIGFYFYSQGRLDEAITNYQAALRLNPIDAKALNNLGAALIHRKEYAEAIKCLKAAVRLRPDYPEAHSNLGVALGWVDRTDEAIRHFGEALRLAPDDVETHNNFANALMVQGKVAAAIDHYRQALKFDPNFTQALNNLGWALAGQRKYAEAIACYDRALQIKPEDELLHKNLAKILAETGRYEEAIRQCTEALRLMPDDAEVHFVLGCVLAQNGRRDEAVTRLKEALRLKPDYAEAKRQLKTLGTPAPE
jgi:Flp pilus assembly protein TadD